jgi:hypothetical protein
LLLTVRGRTVGAWCTLQGGVRVCRHSSLGHTVYTHGVSYRKIRGQKSLLTCGRREHPTSPLRAQPWNITMHSAL